MQFVADGTPAFPGTRSGCYGSFPVIHALRCATIDAPLLEPHPMSTPDPEHVFRYTEEFSETIITAARGACVHDRDGREILDFTSGQMSAILGHAHPEIVATVSEAVARLAHLHSSFLSDVVIDFVDALSALLPESLSRVLPLSTGAESNEAALKMAKLATGRYEVVAFDRSWHGVTGGASAATFNGARRGYGPPVPGVLALPTPHPYRSPFASNGEYDWRSELDWGFDPHRAAAHRHPRADRHRDGDSGSGACRMRGPMSFVCSGSPR